MKDLKILVKDYAPIAHNAITILINILDDKEVLENLAADDTFLETLLHLITVCLSLREQAIIKQYDLRLTSRYQNAKEPNANELSMLLANIAKSEKAVKLLGLKRKTIPKDLTTSPYAITQLLDLFVKGAEGQYNAKANYDYLSYFFADIAQHPDARTYFTTPHKEDDSIIPLSKIIVFTEHKSVIRRRGVASTIKNVSFNTSAHNVLLDPSKVNLLPYILLPLMGPEEYSDEDMDGMPDEVQLLPPDKERESDVEIIKTHLETLLLLTTTREVREILRERKVYPVVRECHLHVDDEAVREICDRIVQVIMRDEPSEEEEQRERIREVDSDEEIVGVL